MSLGTVSLIGEKQVMYTAQMQMRMCDQFFLVVAGLMESLLPVLDSEDGNFRSPPTGEERARKREKKNRRCPCRRFTWKLLRAGNFVTTLNNVCGVRGLAGVHTVSPSFGRRDPRGWGLLPFAKCLSCML